MRRSSIFRIALALSLAAGCGEPEAAGSDPAPTIVGSGARALPDEPGDTVEGDTAEGDTGFAQRRSGAAPEAARCPGVDGPCLNDTEGVAYLWEPGWDHHWAFDYGDPEGPIRRGAADDLVWMQRLEAGVRYALATEGAASATGACGLAAMMPILFGAPQGYFRINVPTDGSGEAPTAITPEEANARLQAAYAAIGFVTETPRVFFDPPIAARMTQETMLQPVLTRRGAVVTDPDGQVHEALVFVLFSPESRRVYVLDRSSAHPAEEPDQVVRQRDIDHQAALLRMLASLGESPIAFAADAACAIPEPLGGAPYRALSPPWQPGG